MKYEKKNYIVSYLIPESHETVKTHHKFVQTATIWISSELRYDVFFRLNYVKWSSFTFFYTKTKQICLQI